MIYDKHIFICTNQRTADAARKSCGESHGMEIVDSFKRKLKEKNTNLRDWVPEWCFPFIFWAAGRVGGRVSARLDWFTGKGIEIAPGTTPQTIGNLTDANGNSLSDHDAIALDFTLIKR